MKMVLPAMAIIMKMGSDSYVQKAARLVKCCQGVDILAEEFIAENRTCEKQACGVDRHCVHQIRIWKVSIADETISFKSLPRSPFHGVGNQNLVGFGMQDRSHARPNLQISLLLEKIFESFGASF